MVALRVVMAAPAGAATVTEFPLPSPNSSPGGIVEGPDGALWFTEQGTARIGRMTTGGSVTEYPLSNPGASPRAITVGRDGALWFTEESFAATSIGRITKDGTLTEFPLSNANVEAPSIVAGPDGALWFTESCPLFTGATQCPNGRIGRMTTSGKVSEVALPTANSSPEAIAVGRDGALWFTEVQCEMLQDSRIFCLRGKLGRVTTAGVITEFRLPRGSDGDPIFAPAGIAAGRDGALWFGLNACEVLEGGVECSDPRIGRITTGGDMSGFRLTGAKSGEPGVITAGPDGALWFAEKVFGGDFGSFGIGRITTRGAVTEFPVPTTESTLGAFQGIKGITAGPDNAVWFTETRAGKIGRITTPAPRLSLKVAPRTGCTSSAVKARVVVTGGAKPARVTLSLDGRRLARTTARSLRVRLPVRGLRSGAHTFKAVAVDKAGVRAVVTRTFRRC
jgi:virginiamycin B lyase